MAEQIAEPITSKIHRKPLALATPFSVMSLCLQNVQHYVTICEQFSSSRARPEAE